MADHYKTLGLTHTATKQEIKDAFRRCALKFHPDRHSQSPKAVKDGASLKFKLASEAYDVLIDDRKRADYDFKHRNSSYNSHYKSSYNYNYRGYGYSGSNTYGAQPGKFDAGFVFRYVTTRGFLLHVAFASALLGGAIVIERSVETLWSMNNSGDTGAVAYIKDSSKQLKITKLGFHFSSSRSLTVCMSYLGCIAEKSFEEIIQSVEKNREQKENS